jgi:hypothetical protein
MTNWAHRLICLAAALAAVSALGPDCATQGPAPVLSKTAEDIPILWEKNGTYSRLGRRVRVLARDRATLAQVPIAEVPVDFTTQMVLVAGTGPTPTEEIGIQITRVWQEGSLIRVQERVTHPGIDQAPGLNPSSPWVVVVIPRSDCNVEGYSTRVPSDLLKARPGSR